MLVLCQFFFEAAFLMNMVVVVIYWAAIHSVIIDTMEGWERWHQYYVHSTPAIVFFINFLITDVKINVKHMRIIPFVTTIYAYINYNATIA